MIHDNSNIYRISVDVHRILSIFQTFFFANFDNLSTVFSVLINSTHLHCTNFQIAQSPSKMSR